MKAGEYFIVTAGEYSDFGIYGAFTALQDFDLDAELEAWCALNAPKHKGWSYSFDKHDFLTGLESRGLIKCAPLLEIHMGDYNEVPDAPEAAARRY